METQQPPALQDIMTLAAQLGVQFSGEASSATFDLDTDDHSPCSLGGTYENSPAGIAIADGDLRRYQLTYQMVAS